MDILISKLDFQGWSDLYLQGDTQCKFLKTELYKFYRHGKVNDFVFDTFVQGKPVVLSASDVTRILGIPKEGWDHYVCQEWPPLNNLPSTLKILQTYSCRPNHT